MTNDALLIENIDSIRRITFNRPERRNPLSYSTAESLVKHLRDAEADTAVTAVILTGTGPAFCVGGDQKDFRQGMEQSSPEVLSNYPPMAVFKLARNYKKPLIAAVNGTAFGGGMGITCASHIAIASDTAKFGVPEIKLGIFPLTILPVIRPILGERRTMELSLTGRAMDAQEALACGVITKIVPEADLSDEALKIAKMVGAFSPLALKLGIEAMQVSSDMGFDEAMEYLNAMRTIFFASKDLNEGATAFLEKRAPVWQGK